MITTLTIILLIYCNLIRFLELKENTTMFSHMQYWFNYKGIVYSLNIIGISVIVYLISLIL
jgi:NADH:ubiquinone oxidoreductase subunit 4 (subunit M)